MSIGLKCSGACRKQIGRTTEKQVEAARRLGSQVPAGEGRMQNGSVDVVGLAWVKADRRGTGVFTRGSRQRGVVMVKSSIDTET